MIDLRVTIQQAAVNALFRRLMPRMPDVKFSSRWPSPDRPLEKSVTILLAGPRQTTPIDVRELGRVPVAVDNSKLDVVWQHKFCSQRLQVDVWATKDVERDDVLARLDDELNAGESTLTPLANPVGQGLLLPVEDGWSKPTYPATFADFLFDEPDIDDTPQSVKRSEYRATIRGMCWVMLSTTRRVAKQKVINIKLHVGETDALPGEPYQIISVTKDGVTYSTGP